MELTATITIWLAHTSTSGCIPKMSKTESITGGWNQNLRVIPSIVRHARPDSHSIWVVAEVFPPCLWHLVGPMAIDVIREPTVDTPTEIRAHNRFQAGKRPTKTIGPILSFYRPECVCVGCLGKINQGVGEKDKSGPRTRGHGCKIIYRLYIIFSSNWDNYHLTTTTYLCCCVSQQFQTLCAAGPWQRRTKLRWISFELQCGGTISEFNCIKEFCLFRNARILLFEHNWMKWNQLLNWLNEHLIQEM